MALYFKLFQINEAWYSLVFSFAHLTEVALVNILLNATDSAAGALVLTAATVKPIKPNRSKTILLLFKLVL
jgi:hypothetical protein